MEMEKGSIIVITTLNNQPRGCKSIKAREYGFMEDYEELLKRTSKPFIDYLDEKYSTLSE
jgi:hypothetical protein